VQCNAAASGIRECNGTQCPGKWGAIALIVTVEFAVDVIQLQRTRARGRRTLSQSWSRVTPGTVTIGPVASRATLYRLRERNRPAESSVSDCGQG
jgi:hypothetical protein